MPGKVEDTEKNVASCKENCGSCPSYPHAQGEWLFCARGKSKGKVSRNGCNCPDCPVFAEYDLEAMYYCDK